jgi:coproporphyrinogen III oxidase-like Fe-S oxidoreductase
VSVETNPGDLVPDVLDRLVAAGVRRLSVGVQSFDDGLLREMGRYDTYGSGAQILEHLGAAAGRFETLNVDMIFNLPHQSAAMLERDLGTVLEGHANQVSLYPLMRAPLAERSMRRSMGLPDRDRLAGFYRRILERLRPAFTPVSAWCFNRGGHGIDEYVVSSPDYLGLGSGAFGYLDGRLYASTFSLHSYLERVGRGLTGITGERRLSGRERMRYDLLMRLFGLRLERRWVRDRYGMRFERSLWPELKLLGALGAVRASADGWALTDRGMFVWVLMMSAFFESVNEFRAQMRLNIRAELDDGDVATFPVRDVGHGRPTHAGRWPAGLGR